MSALLKVEKIKIPEEDYTYNQLETVNIETDYKTLILAEIRSFNPEVQTGRHEWVYNFPVTKKMFAEHNIPIHDHLVEKWDEIDDNQVLPMQLPYVQIFYKDGNTEEFFFFTEKKAQDCLDSLERELEDFYKNYGSYVAMVQAS